MGLTDIWRDIDFYQEDRIHSTQKPMKLIKRLIQASSNAGDLVLDPFAGSGSTIYSAMDLKRDFIAMEFDKGYYDKILERVDEIQHPLKNFV